MEGRLPDLRLVTHRNCPLAVVLRGKQVAVEPVVQVDKQVLVPDTVAVQVVESLVAGKAVRKQVQERADTVDHKPDFPADKPCLGYTVQF